MRISTIRRRRVRTGTMITAAFATVISLAGVSLSSVFVGTPASSATPPNTSCPAGSSLQLPAGGSSAQAQCVITSTGTPVGAIKHVWLIILENKSYDETFTGLNQNSYLWQTLPQQGALLTNYYGTGHFSMDNYISLVSGQAPSYARAGRLLDDGEHDQQQQRDHHDRHGRHRHRHRRHRRRQRAPTPTRRTRPAPATATTASSSCTAASTPRSATTAASTRPTSPTLFNQFNAAGVSWKAYAQDLGGAQPVGSTTYVTGSTPGVSDTVPGRDDGACGYPGHVDQQPRHQPDEPGRPDAVTSRASPAPSRPTPTATATPPTSSWPSTSRPAWFTALTGESAGTQNGVTYPAQPALNEPTTPEYDGPGRPDQRIDRHQLRRQPRRQPGRPHLRPGARPEPPGQRGPGVQLDHAEQLQRRPRRHLPGQQPLGRLQRQRHAELHPGGPAGLRPRGDHADELHRWAVRGRPVPALLHPADRAVGGLRRRRADRHHVRRGQPALHHRQQLQQRAGARRQHHLLGPGRPADLRLGRDHGTGRQLPLRRLRRPRRRRG